MALFQLKHKLYHQPSHAYSAGATKMHGGMFDEHVYAPIVCWPNGAICMPITLYLNSIYSRGQKLRGNSGTLVTYAKNLSHIVRYCSARQIPFHELSDATITEFVRFLQDETGLKEHLVARLRSTTQVRVIARRTFHFLLWLQEALSLRGLISANTSSARINLLTRKHRARGCAVDYFDHPSLPTPDTPKKRFPVSTEHIERLFEANVTSTQSAYVKRRRAALLQLARATGARRAEMADVTITDIRKALETGSLSISVGKTRRKKIREIPVLKSQLEPILQFVDGQRALLIKKAVGANRDPGKLFLTSRGRPLSVETLTNDMHDLARMAGLESNVCLHMFRHRYFTDMAFNMLLGIREFVERKELTAPTEQIILQQMRALSQHEDDKSLLGYVHAAFKEATAWDIGERLWKMSQIHDSMVSALSILKSEIKGNTASAKELLEEFGDLLGEWRADLTQCAVDPAEYPTKLL